VSRTTVIAVSVTVIVIAAVVIATIAGLWWWRRRKRMREDSEGERGEFLSDTDHESRADPTCDLDYLAPEASWR
jgi:hypothetical protein